MWPRIFSFDGLSVHLQGIFLAVGVLAASFVVWKQVRAKGLPEEKVLDIFILALLGMIVGGRLAAVISRADFFLEDFGRVILILKYPGFSFPIGFFWAGVIVTVLSRLEGFVVWQILDIFSLGAILGTIFGLGGCLLGACQLGWSQHAPLVVLGLYVGLFLLMIAVMAMVGRSSRLGVLHRRPGFVFLCYLIFSGVSFLISSKLSQSLTVVIILGIGVLTAFLALRYNEAILWLNFPAMSFRRLRAILRRGGET